MDDTQSVFKWGLTDSLKGFMVQLFGHLSGGGMGEVKSDTKKALMKTLVRTFSFQL